ncbi:MAG: thiol reductant ABC exporter subunit CydC [Anaerolineales bacterium]|nr:thiol reductant ABC exporter subunit CydC [Anaerolineales bacterium]MCX7756303.1 thiol reductant ABC exporter subunit CydC [Anaerolineales bacterium]MDW8276615.1 thiol reductant ABC exporter subunit CydC [Anaerolineales bacterium]
MKTLSRLSSFLLPFWPQVLLAVLLGALTIGSSIALMSTSAWLISTAAIARSVADLGVSVVSTRLFGVSRAVFRYVERLVSHSLTFRILARLRVWFYQAIEPLAPARLVSARSGDLLSRVIADVETLDNLFVRVLAPPMVAVVIVLAMAVFMGSFDPVLGLVITAFLLAVGVGLTAFSLFLNRTLGRQLVESRSILRADLVDAVQGLPDLIAFGQESAWLERINASGREFSRTQTRMAQLNGLQSGLNSLLTGLGAWLMLFLAIPLVSSGRIEGVYLAVIVLASMASFEAVQNLPQAAQLLEANLQSARRLFEIADQSPAVTEPTDPLPQPACADLHVRNLSFSYEPEAEHAAPLVLSNLSFDLPAGKKLAIVGPSGAGKSTLANLLMRFWDAEGIFLDGRDIRAYRQVDVRRMFSLVSQNTYLFNATLRENLLLARPWATQQDIEAACRAAQLHDFIVSLPNGYETMVGERGLQLSGGERQRVAIARALLKDTPIFIFDEPTANLDAATERKLIETLQAVMQSRSVLWITHRLIGLEGMDEILVLEAGRIVQRGTHAELLAQQGLYRTLWDLQNRALL